MRLSVVIPTLNEEAQIAQAVRSAQAAGADEVLVVDGGSGDETLATAEAAGAVVLATRPGRGWQMNAGAVAADGDVLLFLHADNRLPADAGEQIARTLSNPAIVHGAFRQRIDAEGWSYRALESGNAFRARRLATPYGDQGLFVRREAFDRAGGFPDEPIMEDVAIARRLRALGRPALLAGPLRVSPRRWRRNGVVRQTLTNWGLLVAWSLGVPPRRLLAWYRAEPAAQPSKPKNATAHDQPSAAQPVTPATR